MRISAYTPELTVTEADRCWMTPQDVCHLSGSGDSQKPDVRRFLNDVSSREIIPSAKSGSARTSPRLYSVISTIGLRACRELMDAGRTYEFASPIVAHVASLARQLIKDCASISDLDTGDPDWIVVYSARWNGQVENIRTIRSNEVSAATFHGSYSHGVFCAGEVIWNILRGYADYWSRDRIERGLDRPAGRYDGADETGRSLNPAHHSNRNLPPLERAKRLVEIEEYIARREAREKEGDTS